MQPALNLRHLQLHVLDPDSLLAQVYGWPFGLSRKFGMWLKPYTMRRDAMVTSIRSSLHAVVHPIVNCLMCGNRANHATAQGP